MPHATLRKVHLVASSRVRTGGDNRGSTSQFDSISGVPSHAVHGRSFYIVHIVQPSCSWPSYVCIFWQNPFRLQIVVKTI